MAFFDSGVADYLKAKAVVEVNFPIDSKGHVEINCYQCSFFRRSYQTCGLNGAVCEYPSKYVGSNCPLKPVEQEEVKFSNLEDEI